jgi:hypothetical protein
MEVFEVKKYYEWISSNRLGKVEEYIAEDETTVYFQSGRFIPKEQLGIQMRQVDEAVYQAKGGENQFYSPLSPPEPASLDEWEKMLGNPEPNSIAPPSPKEIKEKSPILIILEKQKKMSEESINVEVKLRLPSTKVFEFLSMMFDEDEVIEEIIEFAYSQITSDSINEAIKETIKNYIISNSKDSEAE